MANLEAKTKISPLQLAIVVANTGIGVEMVTESRRLVETAGGQQWLAVMLGAVLFYGVAVAMVKLGEFFPDDTILEYLPRLWGNILGGIFRVWYLLLFMFAFVLVLGAFSRIITFYLFDRTPPEVVALGMLAVCVYCALQDFGTNLRVAQLLFFTTVPAFLLIAATGALSITPDNLLPLWPADLGKVAKGTVHTWGLYTGYEIILLLLPLVNRGTMSIAKTMGCAFGCMGFVYTVLAVITIGVLPAEHAKTLAYPLLEVVRFVELPGTFVERLENYLLVVWIPAAFSTMAIYLYMAAQILMRLNGHGDHRPWVLLLAPLLFFSCNASGSMAQAVQTAHHLNRLLGLAFSLGVIPLSLAVAWWKKRGEQPCRADQELH